MNSIDMCSQCIDEECARLGRRYGNHLALDLYEGMHHLLRRRKCAISEINEDIGTKNCRYAIEHLMLKEQP
jgi:hypothetical protein